MSKTTCAGIGVILTAIGGACTALGNGTDLGTVLTGLIPTIGAGIGLILAKDQQPPTPPAAR